jgi:hypothetical protein
MERFPVCQTSGSADVFFFATKGVGAGLLKEIQLSSVDRAIMCTALEYEHPDLTPRFFNGREKPLFAGTRS